MSPPSIDPAVFRTVFNRLIIEICTRLDVSAPEVEPSAHAPSEPHPAVAVDFAIDEVELTLVHASGVNAARVKLVCRLGTCPAHRRLEVFERLLVLNLALADEPVRLALDPADGTALLISDLALADLDVAGTLHAFDLSVQHAVRWRAGYFLESHSAPLHPSRVGLACALMA